MSQGMQKIMLWHNTWSIAGLVNGATGVAKDFLWETGNR